MHDKGRPMRFPVAILMLFLALSAPAWAADSGTIVYPASFFEPAHPATANDMINRLPGFSLDTGNSARGFAGTAGNVVIDGVRPTAKSDDLQTILTRIPARDVDHIELIRGNAPGLDMQGQSVIANVVRKPDTGSRTVLTVSNTWIEDGEWVPAARLEHNGRIGAADYELALARTVNQWDDSPGLGYRALTTPSGATTYDAAKSYGIMQLGWSAHGAITAPLWGGAWNNNLTLQTNDYSNGIAYSGSGGSRFDNTQAKRNAEFGSHWQGSAGPIALETLFLQRLGDEHDANTDAQPGITEGFFANSSSGESILRLTARYGLAAGMTLEAGGEGAYNFLNGHSRFVSNGTAVSLPNANARVNEKRGEAFTNLTWQVWPSLSLEGGVRVETSDIAETGDNHLERSFLYIKPRALASWTPDELTQIRLRVEKKLGQLDFANFVASSNLSTFGVAAGNANLRPDQRWQFELQMERHFWDKGALVLALMHEDITDLQDYVPVGGGFDAPGNIPHTTNEEINLTATVPLGRLGIANGLLNINGKFDTSSLIDPFTGRVRPESNQRSERVTVEYDQDLPAWNSSFGIGFLPVGGKNSNYRISQVSTVNIHAPYSFASWTWNPSQNWSVKFSADNFTPYRFELRQDIYSGPRGTSPLARVQDVNLRTRPRLGIELSQTV
jgi:hypothetical protein